MEESENSSSIPITGCKVIAFRKDDHPLLGIYPPILNYSSSHAISGVARDGYMEVLHATYDREAFRDEAKAGRVILLEHPQETPPDPVVMCVPAEEVGIFDGVLDMQRAKNASAHVTVLSLKDSLSQLLRCARRNIRYDEIHTHGNLIGTMIATSALHEPERLSFHLRLVRENLLKMKHPETYEAACALTRRFLRRFHVQTPKELL